MPSTTCKACGASISMQAWNCPQCGHPRREKFNIATGCGFFILFLTLFVVGSMMFRACVGPKIHEDVAKVTPPEEPVYQFKYSCNKNEQRTGKYYRITGSEIHIRKKPGFNSAKIINKKASKTVKSTQYASVDSSCVVFEECRKSTWSKIRVADPKWLANSHYGWIPSVFLRERKYDDNGFEIFSDQDFPLNSVIMPYKELIVAGVNKIHRTFQICRNIDLASVYLSPSKSTVGRPVFVVTCGKQKKYRHIFFRKDGTGNLEILPE